jgi:hypothetical protein
MRLAFGDFDMTPSVAALPLIATMSLRPSSLTRRIFRKTRPLRHWIGDGDKN